MGKRTKWKIERVDPRINWVSPEFNPLSDFPLGFLQFLRPLHLEFTPRQQSLAARRRATLSEAHRGRLPQHLVPSEAITGAWSVKVPDWFQDQRVQLCGPADDAAHAARLLAAGAPGVVLDLEDSVVNAWPCLQRGLDTAIRALDGTLGGKSTSIVQIRPRGLHLSQGGVLPGEVTSASLFDVASVAYRADVARLWHPFVFVIPKSECAQEAVWWRDLFRTLAIAKGLPPDAIKCTALVESHPLAYQIEEFASLLRDHLLGLVFGPWDYAASLAQHLWQDPAGVLPDRQALATDGPLLDNPRRLLADLCHKRGMLAIGGAPRLGGPGVGGTDGLLDGVWAWHADAAPPGNLPAPNQGGRRVEGPRYPDLRPKPAGPVTLEGTRAAVRGTIRYRFGVLRGRGASVLDGFHEDLATDRLNRLLLAQRVRHQRVTDLGRLFDEELARIRAELPAGTEPSVAETYARARARAEEMIVREEYDPV